jgi:acid phosphatase class B
MPADKPTAPPKKKNALFDDNDDDDMFINVKKTPQSKQPSSQNPKMGSSASNKKNLFADDSDDDIFAKKEIGKKSRQFN